MNRHYVEHDVNYHVWLHDGRGHKTEVGPRAGWPTPRQAIDYARLLNDAIGFVSPLRAPGEGATVTPPPVAPSAGLADVAPSPVARRRATRRASRRR